MTYDIGQSKYVRLTILPVESPEKDCAGVAQGTT